MTRNRRLQTGYLAKTSSRWGRPSSSGKTLLAGDSRAGCAQPSQSAASALRLGYPQAWRGWLSTESGASWVDSRTRGVKLCACCSLLRVQQVMSVLSIRSAVEYAASAAPSHTLCFWSGLRVELWWTFSKWSVASSSLWAGQSKSRVCTKEQEPGFSVEANKQVKATRGSQLSPNVPGSRRWRCGEFNTRHVSTRNPIGSVVPLPVCQMYLLHVQLHV